MEQVIQYWITELNQSYNDLGEDLLLMEAVVIAMHQENEFPVEYIASGLRRVMDYTEQHLKDIRKSATNLHQRSISAPGEPEAVR